MPAPTIPEFPEGTRYFVWNTSTWSANPQWYHFAVTPTGIHPFSEEGRIGGPPNRYRDIDLMNAEISRDMWREVTREAFCFVLNGYRGYISRSTFVNRRTIRNPRPLPLPPPPPTNHKIGVPKGKLP